MPRPSARSRSPPMTRPAALLASGRPGSLVCRLCRAVAISLACRTVERGGHERQGVAQAQIVIAGVSHCYRPPIARPVLALEDVTLDVRRRECAAPLRPSACRKATLP